MIWHLTRSERRTYMKPKISSSTPSRPSGNYKKSWKTKHKQTLVYTDGEKQQRSREKQIMARFDELGYKRGENGNFPCFCGELDADTAWWMGNCKSKANHLFCPRCTERVFEPDIKETLSNLFNIWKKNKQRMWKEDQSINQLLSKG